MTTEQKPGGRNVGLSAGLDGPRCKCKVNAAEAPHSCPYAQEIGDNNDPEYCTCCDDCRHECCMDI